MFLSFPQHMALHETSVRLKVKFYNNNIMKMIICSFFIKISLTLAIYVNFTTFVHYDEM